MKEIRLRAYFHSNEYNPKDSFLYSPVIVNNSDGQRLRYHDSEWESCDILEFWRSVENYFGKVSIDLHTGLRDRNGKDIYENDIVKVRLISENILPEYKNKEFIWIANIRLGDDETHDIAILEPECLEVIGNVYESNKR